MFDFKKTLEDPRYLPEDLRRVDKNQLIQLYRAFTEKVNTWQHPRGRNDVGGAPRVDTAFQDFSLAQTRIASFLAHDVAGLEWRPGPAMSGHRHG